MSIELTDAKRIHAQIDLGAILHNYQYTKSLTQKRVICVVKTDAYGHGALPVAKKLQQHGADFFAVATIDEALELRNGGITGGILILGYVFEDSIQKAIDNDISLTVASAGAMKSISKAASGKNVKVHIKLNTGMNRTGFNVSHGNIPQDLIDVCEMLLNNKNIEFEGLFSHFAVAEDNCEFSNDQFSKYKITESYFKELGLIPKIRHMCNSAGLTNHPDKLLDAVRLGISLYGCCNKKEDYKPAMQFKTRIVDIHTLCPGDCVSYGITYTAQKNTTMAVIAAGYGDGLPRRLSGNNAYVICHGKRVPIIGRICMDMSMIDISDLTDAKVGDEVTLWGHDGNETISCDEQAQKSGTISYELLCGVSKRVPRIYKNL